MNIDKELERDLHLASLGDYPGAAGCKRMVAHIFGLTSEVERLRQALVHARRCLESSACDEGMVFRDSQIAAALQQSDTGE